MGVEVGGGGDWGAEVEGSLGAMGSGRETEREDRVLASHWRADRLPGGWSTDEMALCLAKRRTMGKALLNMDIRWRVGST